MHEDGSIDDIRSVSFVCTSNVHRKNGRKIAKLETRIKDNMTISTTGLNGNLKYPETTLKIRKMCECFANPLENDIKFSPQTSSDFGHAQTFSSVNYQYCYILFKVDTSLFLFLCI